NTANTCRSAACGLAASALPQPNLFIAPTNIHHHRQMVRKTGSLHHLPHHTLIFVQPPCRNRAVKSTPLTARSAQSATQIPMSPKLNTTPATYAPTSLTRISDANDNFIVV